MQLSISSETRPSHHRGHLLIMMPAQVLAVQLMLCLPEQRRKIMLMIRYANMRLFDDKLSYIRRRQFWGRDPKILGWNIGEGRSGPYHCRVSTRRLQITLTPLNILRLNGSNAVNAEQLTTLVN
jgi:hypothetical protein